MTYGPLSCFPTEIAKDRYSWHHFLQHSLGSLNRQYVIESIRKIISTGG